MAREEGIQDWQGEKGQLPKLTYLAAAKSGSSLTHSMCPGRRFVSAEIHEPSGDFQERIAKPCKNLKKLGHEPRRYQDLALI